MGNQPNLIQLLLNCSQMHARIYPEILSEVREAYLDLMAKPKEVLVVIDENSPGENGEAVEQNDVDVETLYIYEQMRETLILLTNIDTEGMDGIDGMSGKEGTDGISGKDGTENPSAAAGAGVGATGATGTVGATGVTGGAIGVIGAMSTGAGAGVGGCSSAALAR